MYEKNIETLDQVTKEKAAIRHISRHRNPDGTLDVEGNLKIWKDVTSRFERVPLWEKGAPGFDPEDSRQEQPFLIFVPSGQKNSDTILIAHGGGFLWRTGCEGIDTAKYFHDRGFHTAILSYRLLPYSRMDSFADMRRAIRLLRSKTEAWELGEHLYVMGFSAGGMLAANCATQFDYGNPDTDDPVERVSSRPDAAVVGYGAMSAVSFPCEFGKTIENEIWGRNRREQLFLAPEKNISADTPPFFIWQTMSDDGRHGMNLAKALQDAWVPYEIHIFQNGEHGLAMADGNNDLDLDIPHIHHWGELCTEWLKEVIWERKIEKGENVCVGQ
ncbi:alpha/beta hydrolase [Blautia sp. HCP3S3_G3]|uniref:alpha/beta hydrolase n=1 Tax=Blautia sp. HCP3S3_G3 TaxID=3438913 RepID=UPI003F8B3F7A|nr:alpha/beta hydrolase [Ruminococcus sp.]